MISENILIIGSGHRVQDNFLPAIFYLKKKYDLCLVGIYSRTFSNAEKVAKKWNLDALPYNFNLLHLEISMVVISITTNNVIDTLLKLENYKKKLKIIIDTPAFIFFKDLPILKRISNKHDIFVASDFMYFPIFGLLREIKNSNILGKLKKINLVNSGYYYHGTALIRSFFDFLPFLSIRKIGKVKKIFSALNTNKYIYKFRNSVTASISYPYNFEDGYIELLFEQGTLINKNICSEKKNNHYIIENIVKENFIIGHKAEIYGSKFISNLEKIPTLLSFSNSSNTNFNLHKTFGTIDFLKSILINDEKKKYGLFQGIYDSAISKQKISNLPYFFDPYALFNKNFINFFWEK